MMDPIRICSNRGFFVAVEGTFRAPVKSGRSLLGLRPARNAPLKPDRV